MKFRMYPPCAITEEQAQVIADACPEGGVVLEVGTCEGDGARRIYDRLSPLSRLMTVDIDLEYVQEAQLSLPERVLVFHGDAHEWVPPMAPDVVVIDGPIKPEERLDLAWRFRCMYPDAVIFVHDFPEIMHMEAV